MTNDPNEKKEQQQQGSDPNEIKEDKGWPFSNDIEIDDRPDHDKFDRIEDSE